MTWHNYFMKMAEISALKSKDPRTKVGAVLVDENNRIISTGYNGMPKGFPDSQFIWDTDQKYSYVIHAELNAILYARKDLTNCKLYVTLTPCLECTKLIAASGIKEVYFGEDRIFPQTQKEIDFIFESMNIKKQRIV